MSGVLIQNGKRRDGHADVSTWAKIKAGAMGNRAFLAIVVLPTLLTAIYYGLIASNQYESSADFVVRHAENLKEGADVGALLGFSFGSSATEGDALTVQTYLLSHDAVARLRTENHLVDIFSRSGTDLLSRLWPEDPSPENLLKFYRAHVSVAADDETGISHLKVHTFRPADSYAVAEKLMQMGEQQVNAINQRTYADQVANAQRTFDRANHDLNAVEEQLTAYRQTHSDVDPADTGKAQVNLVSQLTASLVAAQARLNAMAGAISHSSPQYQAMLRQVQNLQAQIDAQNGRLAGTKQSLAGRLGDYEQLVIKRQEVAQVYAVASAQLKQAQAEAQRKQLYLIRVVQPNLPVKSEYPERLKIVLTVFGALFFAYGIGWLVLAGIREHAL